MRCDRCGKEVETLVKVGSENLCEECYEEERGFLDSDMSCGCFG